MVGRYIFLPPRAAVEWQSAVADVPSLPASGQEVGEAHLVLSSGAVYYWDGAAWQPTTVAGTIGGSGVAGRIAYFSGASTLTSSAALTFDGTNAGVGSGSAGLLGRTDGSSAASGVIGEIQSATQAALTTVGVGSSGSWGNVTSISVPAGEWDIVGVVTFNDNGANVTDGYKAGISASATGAGIGQFDYSVVNALISSTMDSQAPTPVLTVHLAGATTYYLNTQFAYTSGTPRHAGQIRIIRRR